MFLDQTDIELKTGKGGDGCKSFIRKRFKPNGGPDGGDGGRGGHIILSASCHLHTLYDLEQRRHLKTTSGEPGGPHRHHGKNAKDVILNVPVGTLVIDPDSGQTLYDFHKEGERFTVAQGGAGGRGNCSYKHAGNQAPEKTTRGGPGENKVIRLELKLLADCGLVGFPNAGKSAIIRKLSNATPKIADYPFTTLEPCLGVVKAAPGVTFVLADIPGIIQGAAQGKGLGNRFLKHIERTQCLAYVIDQAEGRCWEQYQALLKELRAYQPALMRKPWLVLLNKNDLGSFSIPAQFEGSGIPVFQSSALSGEGLENFKKEVLKMLGRRHNEPSNWS